MLQAPTSDRKTKAEASSKTAELLPEQESGMARFSGRSPQSYSHPPRENLAALQKSYGNQAVLRMKGRSPAANPVQGALQRKCACGSMAGSSGSCAECQSKREGILQTKLQIGEAGDRYEQEADRVADQVVKISNASLQKQVNPQTHLEKKEDKLTQRKETPTPLSVDLSSSDAPSVVHEVLNSPGQPLDSETLAFMEAGFGHDFSQVRVHTDSKASESARAINALAYTVGQDIVFGANHYAPNTNTGKRLVAHELTHVVQQNSLVSGTTLQRLADPNCSSASGLPLRDSCTAYNNTCYSSSFSASGGTIVNVNVTVDYNDPESCSFPQGREDFRVQLMQCGWIDSKVKDFGTNGIGATLTDSATLPGAGTVYGNDNYYLRVYSRSGCQLTASISIS